MTEPAVLTVKPTGAPFYRLNARLGWRLGPEWSRPQIPYDDRPLQLAIKGRSPIPLDEPFGTFGGRTLPAGLTMSSDGRIYLADPDARVILTMQVNDANTRRPDSASVSWPLRALWAARPLPPRPARSSPTPDCEVQTSARPDDPYTLVRPVAVALAPNGDLVIVDSGASRVLVLALPSARLRHVIDLAPGAPNSVAFDARGRAYIADPVAGTVYRFSRIWQRDCDFPRIDLEEPTFVAAACMAAAECEGTSGCGCSSASTCPPVPAKRAVIHVIDRGKLVSLDDDGRLFAADQAEGADESSLAITPPPLVRTTTGLSWSDPAMPGREPIRIDGLTLAADGTLRGTSLPLMALPRRITLPRFGSATTTAIDGGQSGFGWDRLALSVVMPPTTTIIVSTMTSEVDIAPDRLELVPPERWSRPLAIGPDEVPEVLVQSEVGRYLWVKVEMSGDGTVTPVIEQIDIFGPRRSAMRHLPASFHQDPESVRFLERYLAYFDVVFAEIAAANRGITRLFDPAVVPDEFLGWLGSWFDLDFLSSWPDDVRRQMITEAISYYRMRGTVQGLRRILQWHTGLSDPLPQVIEHFRLPQGGDPIMLCGAKLDPGNRAHSFTIVLPTHAAPQSGRSVLERLIAASIPAHTRHQLCLFDPGVILGARSTVGIDMTLGSIGGAPLGVASLDATLATAPPKPDAPIHYPQQLLSRYSDGGSKC